MAKAKAKAKAKASKLPHAELPQTKSSKRIASKQNLELTTVAQLINPNASPEELRQLQDLIHKIVVSILDYLKGPGNQLTEDEKESFREVGESLITLSYSIGGKAVALETARAGEAIDKINHVTEQINILLGKRKAIGDALQILKDFADLIGSFISLNIPDVIVQGTKLGEELVEFNSKH